MYKIRIQLNGYDRPAIPPGSSISFKTTYAERSSSVSEGSCKFRYVATCSSK